MAESFDSVDTGLAGAEVATEGAAALAREASETLDRLADAMDLSIFGAQPLAPLAEDFAEVADQSAAVADSLDEVGASLSEVRSDAVLIAEELDGLADELDELQERRARRRAAVPAAVRDPAPRLDRGAGGRGAPHRREPAPGPITAPRLIAIGSRAAQKRSSRSSTVSPPALGVRAGSTGS